MNCPTETTYRPASDPLIAPRIFKIERPLDPHCKTLAGVGDHQWVPGPNLGECRRHRFGFADRITAERIRYHRLGPCGSAPSADGTDHKGPGCGISAFCDAGSLLAMTNGSLVVAGEVALWGTIRSDGTNHRAEWGQIHCLWSNGQVPRITAIAAIARHYQVPIVDRRVEPPDDLDCTIATTAEIPAYARLLDAERRIRQLIRRIDDLRADTADPTTEAA